jgi:hypothetical protein
MNSSRANSEISLIDLTINEADEGVNGLSKVNYGLKETNFQLMEGDIPVSGKRMKVEWCFFSDFYYVRGL